MLRHLQVENLVVVEKLALDFESGMTALTGETGAGKSILVDALALALGAPADQSLIRAGCDQAEVSAVFEIDAGSAPSNWLEEQALEADGDCFLRRVLRRGGRSRAFINGRPVPQKLLAELGELLVEIHGQHQHQRLLRASVQRELLDAWAGHGELLREVAGHFRRWRELERQLEQMRQESEERVRRGDYLAFQIDELRQLANDAERLEALEQEHRHLAGAEERLAEFQQLLQMLDEGEPSARSLLARATAETERLASRLAPEISSVAELLENARIQLEEAVTELREQANATDPDPQRLQELEQRLGRLYDTARKHQVPPRKLPTLLTEFEQEQTRLEQLDQLMADAEKEHAEARRAFLETAAKLSDSRKKAARSLSDTITDSLAGLAMEGGRFQVSLEEREPDQATATGLDQVEFLVATNPGQPLAPLSRVASGGELSRLSLAIQVATAALTGTPTLIFDEVDTGIGGAVAETVGRLLRRLGESRQVLCVTHLPQVAARAHHHLRVAKQKGGKAATTAITPLSESERIREIARMVGGSRITKQTLAHAEELLKAP